MPEIFTYTGTDIANDVRAKSGDNGEVQITDELLIAWINNGARRIASADPWLRNTLQTNILAGQATYDLGSLAPAAPIFSFDSIQVNGTPVELLSWGEFQTQISSNGIGAATTSGDVKLAAFFGNALTLWPVPTYSTANAMTIFYTALPAKIATLADTLPVPDRYFNSLNDYVMQQALELDQDWEAAEVKRQHSESSIREQLNRADQSPTDYYAAISGDPADEFSYPGAF